MKTYPVSYTKTVAMLTALSGFLALLCLVLSGLALWDRPQAFSNPVEILAIPNVNTSLLRWSMLADMFGYYLLLLPAIYWLKSYQSNLWADLITFCGTAYVLIGAIGASILAVLTPLLIADYAAAVPELKESVRLVYKTIMSLVYGGLWNGLEVLLAGVWWLLTGYFLTIFSKAFRRTTILLGAFTLLDGVGNLLGLQTLAEIGLNLYLILAPAWAIWLGILIWKLPYPTVVKTERKQPMGVAKMLPVSPK